MPEIKPQVPLTLTPCLALFPFFPLSCCHLCSFSQKHWLHKKEKLRAIINVDWKSNSIQNYHTEKNRCLFIVNTCLASLYFACSLLLLLIEDSKIWQSSQENIPEVFFYRPAAASGAFTAGAGGGVVCAAVLVLSLRVRVLAGHLQTCSCILKLRRVLSRGIESYVLRKV